MHTNHQTSAEEFAKAVDTLKEAIAFAELSKANLSTYMIARDACIQRFEYCIELAWKTSMRKLGSQVKHAKVAVREMARAGLIDSAELWLDFIEARNETSHSYDEQVAQKVFSQLVRFSEEAPGLLLRLRKLP